ncbi:uncharacterized protein [Centroberyx affinis]|uniref:uncharacterized protein n=1 Tax=Centroberyx affinis TaxID=166261 RepID=UPI003A5BCAE8
MEGSAEKEKNGHLNPAFHLKVVGPINKASSHKGLSHTSKEVLPLRPGPAPNGTQPVNIVRPLRPVPSPQGAARDLKAVRPPLPAGKPPAAPPKSPSTPQRLTPPKKPLPLNPTRSPLLVSELQPRPSPFPPQRPLPLSPARGALPTVSPARTPLSKPSTGLLVMMPPAIGPKPVGKVSAIPPLKALRPVPGAKPNTASPPLRK